MSYKHPTVKHVFPHFSTIIVIVTHLCNHCVHAENFYSILMSYGYHSWEIYAHFTLPNIKVTHRFNKTVFSKSKFK